MICTSGDICNDSVERTTSWTGLVGLMSQYDIWGANGWLYDPGTEIWPWSITPNAYSNGAMLVWSLFGSYVANEYSSSHYGVFPSVYLNSNVQIIGGNGYTES